MNPPKRSMNDNTEILSTAEAMTLLSKDPVGLPRGQRHVVRILDRLFQQRRPPFTQPQLDQWAAENLVCTWPKELLNE